MNSQAFFRSRITSWVLGLVLLAVLVLAAKIMTQKYQVDKEIAKLEDQVEKIKQDNQQLSSMIKYFSTPEYQEKAAREKLNLKKEGEVVVGLPSFDEKIAGAQTQTGEPPNYKKWFDYFFSRPQ